MAEDCYHAKSKPWARWGVLIPVTRTCQFCGRAFVGSRGGRWCSSCPRKAFGAYKLHQRNAVGRKADFLLTFEEWLKIWMDSGHWEERGRGIDQYVMARFGDKGPYAVGNVKVITVKENHAEMMEHRRRSVWSDQERLAAATRNLIIRECPYCGKVGKSSVMFRWHFERCPKAGGSVYA